MLYFIRKFLDKKRFGAARSGSWPRFRKIWLKEHPTCAVCGGRKKVEVHHIEPFNVNPLKELDFSNFISLCRPNGCHLIFGHLGDWASWNNDVVQDAESMLNKINNRP